MTFDIAPPADSGLADDAIRAPTTELGRALALTVAGGLVAAVTHDLRQPLTAMEMNIAAAMQLLSGPSIQLEGALEALRDALVQQGRMRESLQVLDDLSVHRKPLRELLDVVPIARDVVALVGSEVLARHASLALVVSSPVTPVFGDAALIRQALLNMVLDALEATATSLRLKQPVLLTVQQVEGCVEMIVTHFGLRREAAGVDGWGLALARSVVVAHGGTIALEGDADAGVRLITRWPTAMHPMSGGTPHA
jgi:signal transduction histidine kinase